MSAARRGASDLGRRAELAHRRFGLGQALGGRRPNVDLELAPLRNDVGPRPAGDLADVHGHARPAAVELVQLADDPRCLEDRVAALLGLDPGVRGPAMDGQAQVEDALAGRHDVAVGAGTLEDQARIDVRGGLPDVHDRGRRADLLVGVGDERQPLERQPAKLADERLQRVEPGEQARLHVGDARAWRGAVIDAERSFGRSPRVEDRVHVADQQDPRAIGLAAEGRHDRVAEAPLGIGPDIDVGAEVRQEARRPAPDLVHALGRVRPAIDVDELLEILEVGRQVVRDRAAERRRSRGRVAVVPVVIGASLRGVRIAILP